MWDPMSVDQAIFKPPESGATEVLQAGKATPYLESVSIPETVNLWPFQEKKMSQCHNWSPSILLVSLRNSA